jgi:protein SCO1/2
MVNRAKTHGWLLLSAGTLILLGGSYWATRAVLRHEPSLPMIQQAPDFELINQDRQPVRLSQLRGRVKLLAFFYVRCSEPTRCPLTTRKFRAVQERIAQAGVSDRVTFLSITFDPEFDTPVILKAYAERYGAQLSNWHFLTGDKSTVNKVCADYEVIHEAAEPAGLSIRHSVVAYLIDAENRVRRLYFASAWDPDEVATDMVALLGSKHSPGSNRQDTSL